MPSHPLLHHCVDNLGAGSEAGRARAGAHEAQLGEGRTGLTGGGHDSGESDAASALR